MSIFSRVKKPAAIEPSPPAGVGGARRDGSHPLPSPLTQQPPGTNTTKTNGVHPLPVPKPPGATPMSDIPVASPSPPLPASSPSSASANGVANGKGTSHRPSNGVTAKAPPSTSPPSSTPPTTATPTPASGRDPASGPIDLVIEMALEAAASEEEPPAIPVPGTSTAADQAGVRATFEDVAVPYMAEVRGLMLELQYGDVQSSWFERARPLVRSLRRMAGPVGHGALAEALDKLDLAIADLLAPGQPAVPSPAARHALLAAYAPLRASLPAAFDLEGERARREPLIVRALLEQVPGLEPVAIEALVTAGFGTLPALYAARADQTAAVSGVGPMVAAAIAARVQAFRRTTPAGLGSIDQVATLRNLERLRDALRTQHAAFDAVGRGWAEQDQSAKRQARRERQVTFLQIAIDLVRLGEIAFVQRLEKMPFASKLDELTRFIGQALQTEKGKSRSAVPPPPAAPTTPTIRGEEGTDRHG